jgi:NitT/TauT family transport system substrate-binding protein
MNRQIFKLLAVLAMLSGCGFEENAGDLNTTGNQVDAAVRLALNWYPETEHGGYFAAEVGGHFARQGLAVEIIPGGPGAPQTVIAELAAERIQFAVSSADNVVRARAAGVPVVAVLAALQDSPRCIMVHESAGFQALADLKNVELAISETRSFALWMKQELPLEGVTFVPFNGLVGEFLLKPNFAQQAYVFSEPFIAKEKGGDPQSLMVSEIGFNPYSSVLITTESVIAEQEELVRNVVECCQKGWVDYLRSPDESNRYIQELNEEMSAAALAYGATAMQPLCQPEPGQPFGTMTLQRWEELVNQITELGEISEGTVTAAECFQTRFLVPATELEN